MTAVASTFAIVRVADTAWIAAMFFVPKIPMWSADEEVTHGAYILCDADCAPYLHVHPSPYQQPPAKFVTNPWSYNVEWWRKWRPATLSEMIGWALARMD